MGECWPFVIQGRIDVKLFYFYSRDELHIHSRKKKKHYTKFWPCLLPVLMLTPKQINMCVLFLFGSLAGCL